MHQEEDLIAQESQNSFSFSCVGFEICMIWAEINMPLKHWHVSESGFGHLLSESVFTLHASFFQHDHHDDSLSVASEMKC